MSYYNIYKYQNIIMYNKLNNLNREIFYQQNKILTKCSRYFNKYLYEQGIYNKTERDDLCRNKKNYINIICE